MGLWVRAMGQETLYGAVGARYGAGGVPMGLWVRAMGQEMPYGAVGPCYGAVGARYGAGGVPMGLWVRAMGQEAPYGYLLWGRRRPMGLWVPAMGQEMPYGAVGPRYGAVGARYGAGGALTPPCPPQAAQWVLPHSPALSRFYLSSQRGAARRLVLRL